MHYAQKGSGMQSRQGYTLVELLVVITIIGILAAVCVPMMQGRIDSAKWSEGRAMMGTIARALRTHIAEKGSDFTHVPTLAELGMTPADLNGTYFTGGESGVGNFSWVINSNNPIDFLVTATAPPGISSPSRLTLNQAGTFTETP
jgi:type IV pilus assembly protein PilA